MYCKYCGAKLEDEVTVCPNCGEVTEDTAGQKFHAPEKKEPAMVPVKVVAAIAIMVVLAAALVTVVLMGGLGFGEDVTDPEQIIATIPPDGNPDDETCKGTYTVTDAELQAQLDTVVATVGEHKLTNGMLQIYYWNQVYDLLNNYGAYVVYLGLDYTQPLDVQSAGENLGTWQQYFLKEAIASWHRLTVLAELGEKAGMTLDADLQASLDSFQDDLEKEAKDAKYASAQAYLEAMVCPGCTAENYEKYLRVNYMAYHYVQTMTDRQEVTMEQINQFYDENVEEYKDLKEKGAEVVDVRHILLFPGGTQKDSYTDAQWADCLTKAQTLLQQWKDGEATEDSFSELAKKNSQDGNAADGGLYTGVTEGYMVETFDAWIFDENRQYGDTDIVKTEFGYHLMYFVQREPQWVATIRVQILTNYQNDLVEDAMENSKASVEYGKVVLGLVDLVGEN